MVDETVFHRPSTIDHPLIFPGDHGEEETPVPIPNTEVKGLSGDGTSALAVGE